MTEPTGRSQRYDIHIIGHLAPRWAALFEGMSLTAHDDGTTVIHGAVADQSALHGLIRTLSDLGLPLISIRPAADTAQATATPLSANQPLRTSHNPRRSTP